MAGNGSSTSSIEYSGSDMLDTKYRGTGGTDLQEFRVVPFQLRLKPKHLCGVSADGNWPAAAPTTRNKHLRMTRQQKKQAWSFMSRTQHWDAAACPLCYNLTLWDKNRSKEVPAIKEEAGTAFTIPTPGYQQTESAGRKRAISAQGYENQRGQPGVDKRYHLHPDRTAQLLSLRGYGLGESLCTGLEHGTEHGCRSMPQSI